jgi:hypothetical protein
MSPSACSSPGSARSMIQFIRRILPAANRVVLVGIALLDFVTLGVGVLGDVATQEALTAGFVLTLINAKGALFIKGWQQFEKAIYQSDLLRAEAAARAEQAAAASQRGRGSNVSLPR